MKISLDMKPIFLKNYEKQYMFNEQIQNKLDSATTALEQNHPGVEKVKAVLKEGEKFIDAPQKNIKFIQ